MLKSSTEFQLNAFLEILPHSCDGEMKRGTAARNISGNTTVPTRCRNNAQAPRHKHFSKYSRTPAMLESFMELKPDTFLEMQPHSCDDAIKHGTAARSISRNTSTALLPEAILEMRPYPCAAEIKRGTAARGNSGNATVSLRC